MVDMALDHIQEVDFARGDEAAGDLDALIPPSKVREREAELPAEATT